jgi:hypothetical protein
MATSTNIVQSHFAETLPVVLRYDCTSGMCVRVSLFPRSIYSHTDAATHHAGYPLTRFLLAVIITRREAACDPTCFGSFMMCLCY